MLPHQQHQIERRMREVLQRDLLGAIRNGPNPFMAHEDEAERLATFACYRGGAIKYFQHGRPPEDSVTFYNDVYSRAPNTLRMGVYTEEKDPEPGRPVDDVEDNLARLHTTAYETGLKALHTRMQNIGASFKALPQSATCYGLAGDGVVTKTYSREEMLPHFSAPHLASLQRELPEKFTASTELGFMRCIGLISPDPDIGWSLYKGGQIDGSKTPVLPSRRERILSAVLSLGAIYGQNEANMQNNGDAVAAWMLDAYNAASTLGSKLQDPATKEMIAGLTLLNLASLGVSVHDPKDPTKLSMPFFLRDAAAGKEGAPGWLTTRLNEVADWNERVNDEFTRALQGEVLRIYRSVFTGFGRNASNVFNFSPDEAAVTDGLFRKLHGFVPTATELYRSDFRLDGEAFQEAFPGLAKEAPSIIARANSLMYADLCLNNIESRDRSSEGEFGLKKHDRVSRHGRKPGAGDPPPFS